MTHGRPMIAGRTMRFPTEFGIADGETVYIVEGVELGDSFDAPVNALSDVVYSHSVTDIIDEREGKALVRAEYQGFVSSGRTQCETGCGQPVVRDGLCHNCI